MPDTPSTIKPSSGGSADGLGTYGSTGSSGGNAEFTDADLDTMVSAIAEANGVATLVSARRRAVMEARIQKLFGVKQAQEKKELEVLLCYYFGAHGTSPDTHWRSYGEDYPMVLHSRSVNPSDVVDIIGPERLKKYMGHYSALAMRMAKTNTAFINSLRERSARMGLASGQEYLAIDFVGKDGSLSVAEASARSNARVAALNYRSGNIVNISEAKHQAERVEPSSHRAGAVRHRVMDFDV